MLENGPDPTSLVVRAMASPGGSFTSSQNRAIIIVALVLACISLLIVFVTLRWFLLMRRLFRHRLILLLVASDSFKAIWYFVFGIVNLSHRVSSQSGFCQASGFLLQMAIEASDAAILIIALHTVLCIFKPSAKSGEAGLYPYRRWIVPFWVGPPILSASLAFINGENAYVTAGTYCFLPKRPFWYRLALSWIPRYIIVCLILLMYIAIYVYVRTKFRGFKNLAAPDSSRDSAFTSRRTTEATTSDPFASQRHSLNAPIPVALQKPRGNRPGILRGHSYNSVIGPNHPHESSEPWDNMNFITQNPITIPNFTSNGSDSDTPAHTPPIIDSRKESQTTAFTSDTAVTQTPFESVLKTSGDNGTRDHLQKTRSAIRKQLRFLFIYPIIYVIMWAFPFASHVTNYFDDFVQHPIFWLNLMSTISLALQAGVNGLVFSIKEKPWRRIDKDSTFSINFRFWEKAQQPEEGKEEEEKEDDAPPAVTPHWWEAEGRKRRDSVWMGTDVLTNITSRRHQRTATLASINERSPV